MPTDVISLNEVTPCEPRYQQSIQSATGVTWHSVHVVAQADGTGNQLLSKHAILTTSSYPMKTNGQYSRAVVQATINLQGRAVNLFSTHLDHADPAVRSAQIDELIAFMSRFAEPRSARRLERPADSAEVLKLTRSYSDAWEIARAASGASAYPPDNPVDLLTRTHRTRIDYVLYSSAAEQILVESADVPDTRDLTNTAVRKLLGTSDDKGVSPSDHNISCWGSQFGRTRRHRSSRTLTPREHSPRARVALRCRCRAMNTLRAAMTPRPPRILRCGGASRPRTAAPISRLP